MASQTQIEANRRNSQLSTGPKTEAGKARARLNALKDGTHAKTVSRVLPQEDPVELDRRIAQWIKDLNPRNDVERELVTRAAKLAWTLDRAERCETARLAHHVRKAQLKAKARRLKEVGELGRRLLYNAGARILPTSGPPWEDNPAAFLAGLEETAEGCRWREIADRPADAAAAIRFFETLMDEQVARLEDLLELHEEIAGDEAAELADRASCDGSAGAERLRRMQTARGRELRQTLELLMKMQNAENNGQAAGDDGKMKVGEKTATETPEPARASKLATSSEEQREAGSEAKTASRKRPRDKYRSMAALEMVMSERLAEQAFEMCFEDPPAVLAALKGSPKLAELKVLPGRAPVRASGASQNAATSEKGSENAQIEANSDETQAVESQKDRTHNPDSGGEKRTQLRDEDSLGHG